MTVLIGSFLFYLSRVVNSSQSNNVVKVDGVIESEGIAKDPTSDWEKYNVMDLGLTLRYPSNDYKVVDCPGYVSTIYRSPKIFDVNFCASSNSSLKISKLSKNFIFSKENSSGYVIHKSTITIGNIVSEKHLGLKASNDSGAVSTTSSSILATSPSLFITVLIPKADYVLEATINIYGDENSSDLDVFEQIINTFIFDF